LPLKSGFEQVHRVSFDRESNLVKTPFSWRFAGWYAFTMGMLLAGVEYFAAALVGMVMAIFPTVLVSYAIFPPDGPIGEGFAIMLIYFIAFLRLCSRVCSFDETA